MGDAHAADLRAYAALIRRARSVSVVGADMMDGKYSLRGSVRRSLLAQAAAEAGVPTRILGFSWNAAARLAARRSLIAASRAGVSINTWLIRAAAAATDTDTAARPPTTGASSGGQHYTGWVR